MINATYTYFYVTIRGSMLVASCVALVLNLYVLGQLQKDTVNQEIVNGNKFSRLAESTKN